MPAAIAVSASVAAAVWRVRGTEMAHWLLLTTTTRGSGQTPAKSSASATSPLEVALSPSTQTAQCGSARSLEASATPAACGAWLPTGTETGRSSRGPAKSLPRSLPPQERNRSRIVTPRQSCAPCSRKLRTSTCSGRIAAATPTETAS